MRIGRGTGGLLCYGKGLGGSASSNPNSFILARIVRGDRHRKSATSSTDWRSLMHQMRSRVSLSLQGSVEYKGRFFVLLMHTKPFRKRAVPSRFKNTQAAARMEWQPSAGPTRSAAHGRRSVAPGRARYTMSRARSRIVAGLRPRLPAANSSAAGCVMKDAFRSLQRGNLAELHRPRTYRRLASCCRSPGVR